MQHPLRRLAARTIFTSTKPVPPDPILGLVARYKADPNPYAVNLAQGAYRDEFGQPFVLSAVKKAEMLIASQLANGEIDKEYLGIEGNPDFLHATAKFAFGESLHDQLLPRLAVVQSLSGTGALRLAADTLFTVANVKHIYLSDPSWGNHAKIFQASGLETRQYRYLDRETGTTLDFQSMREDMETHVPKGSVVLLHACAHNPTGIDPTPDQWSELSDIFVRRGLIPLFDSAYQGYASGDPDVDALSIREFASRKEIETMLVCQSYAKNMGMYGERVGALNIVTRCEEERDAVLSQVKQTVIRPMYSSPPLHGSRLASLLLTNSELHEEWRSDLMRMALRIQNVRRELVVALERQPGNGDTSWRHITDQIGMFAFTGSTETMVDELLSKHGIYLTRDGRMSLAGMKSDEVERVAGAMVEVNGRKKGRGKDGQCT